MYADILLSSNSWLAWWINETYYNRLHYVWCAPPTTTAQITNPSSSNPTGLCSQFASAVRQHDGGAAVVSQNKTGLLRGVAAKLAGGVINRDQAKEIKNAVKNAPLHSFRPLLYIIPITTVVRPRMQQPKPLTKAKLDSDEFIVSSLDASEFAIFPYMDL